MLTKTYKYSLIAMTTILLFILGALFFTKRVLDYHFQNRDEVVALRLLAPAAPAKIIDNLVKVNYKKVVNKSNTFNVYHNVDGDTFTILISGYEFGIRVKGLDTPESRSPKTSSQCYGHKSAEYTKRILPSGSRVRLSIEESDMKRTAGLDKYGRIIAHVYLDNGELLAEKIIASGHGAHFLYRKQSHMYQERFETAQNKALAEKLGMWAEHSRGGCSYKPGIPYTSQQGR